MAEARLGGLEPPTQGRCGRCWIFKPLCVCGEFVPRETRTRVIIVMHRRELTLATNTARLAALCLSRCEIRVRGLEDERLSQQGLVPTADVQPVVLFPYEDAEVLDPAWLDRHDVASRPVTLIVPDGNWRQGRKAATREPGLKDLPRVKLAPGPLSRYRLRKEHQPQFVSTFEAIARALGVLEGNPVLREELEAFFEKRVERSLWASGKLREEDCQFPIPQAARDAFYAAGVRGGRPPRLRP